MVTCDVQVSDADYQITRCGNTAVYQLVNGSERVCQFHRDGAVAIAPQTARDFTPLRVELYDPCTPAKQACGCMGWITRHGELGVYHACSTPPFEYESHYWHDGLDYGTWASFQAGSPPRSV